MYLEMGEQAMAQALTQRGGLGISQVIAKSLAGHEQARPDTPQKTGLTIPPSRTISVHESAGLSPPRPNYNEDQ
jgi:Rod binding domain-containing protein